MPRSGTFDFSSFLPPRSATSLLLPEDLQDAIQVIVREVVDLQGAFSTAFLDQAHLGAERSLQLLDERLHLGALLLGRSGGALLGLLPLGLLHELLGVAHAQLASGHLGGELRHLRQARHAEQRAHGPRSTGPWPPWPSHHRAVRAGAGRWPRWGA